MARIDPDVQSDLKGELAKRKLSIQKGIEGLALWFLEDPDRRANLIRAYLVAKAAGTSGTPQPTKQRGGPGSRRRRSGKTNGKR